MLNRLFEQKQPLFIPFLMAGYPSLAVTKQAIHVLSEAGADLIELGVPFSDPVADGPINQLAAAVSLQQGTHLNAVFDLVKTVRLEGCLTPIVLFSYVNPILAYGMDAFIKTACATGVQGLLIVDLPPEEGALFYGDLKAAGLECILLASPTTDPVRFEHYRPLNPAFLYYISRCAVTGVQEALSQGLADEVHALKTHFPDYPIVVGFGVSTPEQAAAVARMADGVVVGSALVQSLGTEGMDGFTKRVQALVAAVKNG